MKKLMLSTILSFAASSIMWAQIHFDVKLGVSPGTNAATNAIIVNRDKPLEEFQLSMVHTNPQFYGGIKTHVDLRAPFFMEGGLSYTKKTSMYNVDFTITPGEPLTKIMQMSESEDILLLPVDIGVSIRGFDFTSGLRLNKTISSKNEMSHMKGYSANAPSLQIGWQMGIRYGFANVMAGIEFQGNLNRICEGTYINHKSLAMQNVPGRFAFTLQYRI